MSSNTNVLKTLVDRHFQDNAGWLEMIKALRHASGFELDKAIAFAFEHEGWRRWCNHRINTDRTCRKQAFADIKANGDQSLIGLDGETLRIFGPH